jgi:hypothetical protein
MAGGGWLEDYQTPLILFGFSFSRMMRGGNFIDLELAVLYNVHYFIYSISDHTII